MQTFLPYASFKDSAKCLDMKRLGKQRVETLQLLNSMTGITNGRGWKNHPCRDMWMNNIPALIEYGLVICKEWVNRGYKDTCYDKIAAFGVERSPSLPWWFGDSNFHTSHKANLIRKKPEHYRSMWANVDDALPYLWPVNDTQTYKII